MTCGRRWDAGLRADIQQEQLPLVLEAAMDWKGHETALLRLRNKQSLLSH